MKITVLSVNVTTVPTAKGSYQMAEVAFKNNTFGDKVEGKKLMSFGAGAETFKVLSAAASGDSYEVVTVKNDKGYLDWVSCVKSIPGQGPAAPTNAVQPGPKGPTPAPRSTYETPEERARRQVLIVRQSSLGAAIATLSVGAKNVSAGAVIDMAKTYEAYVFGTGASGFDDFPDVPDEFIGNDKALPAIV